MRRKLVVGNWKLNGSLAENQTLIGQLLVQLKSCQQTDVVVCPPYTYLFQAQQLLQGSAIAWGSQNVSQFSRGAYTACISAEMIAEFGCRYAIIGHSERRAINNESYQKSALRLTRAVQVGITPIYCVGEKHDERHPTHAQAVIESQLQAVVSVIDDKIFNRAKLNHLVIAYEPVWAIGSDNNATPDQAQAMHAFIRNLIALRDSEFAAKVRIIYGGNVTPGNAKSLFAMPDIDGGLVGRCSLNARDFSQICMSACEASDCKTPTDSLIY